MEGKRECKRRRRTSVAASILLIAIAFAFIAVTPVVAQPVEVRVNASEYVDVGATFVITIDITDVTDLNSAQFDLSFDPDVVKISEIKKAEINGEEFPTFMHRSVAEGTERVLVSMPFGKGVSGSGYLAEIEFKAKGEEGEKSELNLSKGMLGNISAGKISAEWISSEIRIGEEEREEEEEEEEVGEEVSLGSPNITAWNPADAVVSNVVGESRTFNITVDQIAVISWQINGTEVQTNESTREAVFTKSAVIGTWKVSVIATNTTTGLSDMHTWIWSVTLTPTETVTPTPTLAPGVTPVPEAETETEETPTPQGKKAAPKEKTTPVPAATPTPKPSGFEAIFAIAVMFVTAYIQLIKR